MLSRLPLPRLQSQILEPVSETEVTVVGVDALSARDRLTMATAKSLQEDFLHQNAFDAVDTYTSLEKQEKMLEVILHLHREAQAALEAGAEIAGLLELPAWEDVARVRFVPEDQLEQFDELKQKISDEIAKLNPEMEEAEKEMG